MLMRWTEVGDRCIRMVPLIGSCCTSIILKGPWVGLASLPKYGLSRSQWIRTLSLMQNSCGMHLQFLALVVDCDWACLTRFAWWRQDLHAIELLRAHIREWTITWMLDYWWVMCFTSYRLKWNSWIWIPFPIDSDCTLLCAQVDKTRYSSIASGNNCIVQLCKCISLHL
jgi:hypothetical protein